MAEALILQAAGESGGGRGYTLNCENHVVMGYQTGGTVYMRFPIGFLPFDNAEMVWKISNAGLLAERTIRYSAIGGASAITVQGFTVSLTRQNADRAWYRQQTPSSSSPCPMLVHLLISFPTEDTVDRGVIGLVTIQNMRLVCQ